MRTLITAAVLLAGTALPALHPVRAQDTAAVLAQIDERLPGTLIYLYLGADRNSADAGIHLSHGDTVVCDFDNGPRLSNLIEWENVHV